MKREAMRVPACFCHLRARDPTILQISESFVSGKRGRTERHASVCGPLTSMPMDSVDVLRGSSWSTADQRTLSRPSNAMMLSTVWRQIFSRDIPFYSGSPTRNPSESVWCKPVAAPTFPSGQCNKTEKSRQGSCLVNPTSLSKPRSKAADGSTRPYFCAEEAGQSHCTHLSGSFGTQHL